MSATTPTSIGRALAALGDEWSLLIVRAALWGAERFGDFRNRLGISESVLASRLRDLVDFGVLSADDDGAYRLTSAGQDLWRVLAAIWSWERTAIPGQDQALPELRHAGCGVTHLELRCACCGAVTTLDDVEIFATRPDAVERSVPPGSRRRRSARRGEDPLGLGNYDATMTLIGSRWSSAHLGALLLGARRFGEVERMTGATPNVVSERLGEFVDLGVIEPVDGAYEFTDRGRSFFVVVAPFIAWALLHHPDADGPVLSVSHRGCSEPFVPRLCCAICGRNVEADDLRAVRPEP